MDSLPSAISPVPRDRWWLHGSLLAVTFLTMTLAGAQFAHDFTYAAAPFGPDYLDRLWRMLSSGGAGLAAGLPYSLTLISILMAHELGHYVACKHYGVGASPPYFLPFPFGIGTFGAFIRMWPPLPSRAALFDIGIAGPLAGFLFILPAIAIGTAYSKALPGNGGDWLFGAPLLQTWMSHALFPGVDANDIYLHPVARAAWAGLLATAFNLLPAGQLDGGHLVFAFLPRRHRTISNLVVAVLLCLGLFLWFGWLLWALILLLFGRCHPPVYGSQPLSRGRIVLGVLAAAVFLVSFMPAPVGLVSLIDILGEV